MVASTVRKMLREFTNPRVEEGFQARQEYLTRIIFIMVSIGLLIMTIFVLSINYGFGEPNHDVTIVILGMDLLVVFGWFLLQKNHWQVSGYLLSCVFLVFSAFMVFSAGLVTTAVLQLAIAILLAGMLSGNRARWTMLLVCMLVYLGAGWGSGERDVEVFLTSGLTLLISLSGIAVLEMFFSNLLNKSIYTVREREAKIQSIFRAAPIGIGMVINRVFQETNDTLCLMTGYTRDEMIGNNARMLYLSQEEYENVGAEKYRQITEQGVGVVETRWKRKDSVIRDILLSSVPLNPNDLTQGVTFSALDITERKVAEKKQIGLLKEKEILLAEVHHRVKNNMQIIASLLGLQAREIEDARLLAAFDESRNRINSMALVHEQLYRAREYAQIEFDNYIDQLAS